MVIEGQVVFAAETAPFEGATLVVHLEDTTYADARAIAVASLIVPDVALRADASGGALAIPFELVIDSPPPSPHRLTLRVLVDLDGDRRLGRGDYVNAMSVRVPQDVERARVEVPVTRVT
jgi:hypothetical protein